MSAAAPAPGVGPPRAMPSEPWPGRQQHSGYPDPDQLRPDEARHLAAVTRSLGWADESAERGDHFDALSWLEMVVAIGDELPQVYKIRREAWLLALGANRREV